MSHCQHCEALHAEHRRLTDALARVEGELQALRQHFRDCGECLDCLKESDPALGREMETGNVRQIR